MNSKFVVLFLSAISLIFLPAAGAIETQNQKVRPSGEDEFRDIPFLRTKDGAEIMLPIRTLYTTKVTNGDESILAINYHETSDYDGCDLVVNQKNLYFVLPNIWNSIEPEATSLKILPQAKWDKIQLEIKSIDGNKLNCEFRGSASSSDVSMNKKIALTIDFSGGAADLKVLAEGK